MQDSIGKSINTTLRWIAVWLFFIAVHSCDIRDAIKGRNAGERADVNKSQLSPQGGEIKRS